MKSYEYIAEPTSTGFSAYLPELDGVVSTGASLGALETDLREAIALHLELSPDEDFRLYRRVDVTSPVQILESSALRTVVEFSDTVTMVMSLVTQQPAREVTGGAVANC
jgi:predicted RNase H-like HicB family nuclease